MLQKSTIHKNVSNSSLKKVLTLIIFDGKTIASKVQRYGTLIALMPTCADRYGTGTTTLLIPVHRHQVPVPILWGMTKLIAA